MLRFAIIIFVSLLASVVSVASKPLKVLAIGNSFSQDAVEQYLHNLAAADGKEIIIGNMFIGGCSLETHYNNMVNNAANYAYRKIGLDGIKQETGNKTIESALADEQWDYVSLQQVSGLSGDYSSYNPYLPELISYVKTKLPSAKIILHQTWAYAQNSTHSEFARYGKDQMNMYNCIIKATTQAYNDNSMDLLIPCGTAVQNARTTFIGDYMNRDGYHLNVVYGRYTAACTWYESLFQTSVVGNEFVPDGMNASLKLATQTAAHEAFNNPYAVTDLSYIENSVNSRKHYVNTTAKGSGDGSSWDNAMAFADFYENVNSYDDGDNIHFAGGKYVAKATLYVKMGLNLIGATTGERTAFSGDSSSDAKTVEKRFSVLGLGDSITEGGKDFNSYLYPLWERLFTAGYNADFIGPRQSETRIGMINHYGNSGKPVEFLEERIDSVYRQYPADIVLLHAGHNHFVEQKPIDGIIRAYESIVTKILAVNPNAHIFLAQVTPSGKLPKYSYIPELNGRIAAFVGDANNKHLHLVDMATGHDYRTMTIHDMVHPNDLGAERMADRWLEAIERVFKPHRKAFRPEKITYRELSDGTKLDMHVFRAKKKKHNPVITYFFAGGWKYGSPLQFYRECEWHSRHGYTAISVDYRISSMHGTTAKDATADGIAAIEYIRKNADELGIDTSRIIVAGASAGATIAGKIPDRQVSARMLYYPVVDSLSTDVDAITKPTLFMIGTKDSFTDISKARNFISHLQSNTTPLTYYIYEGLGHPLFRYREPLTDVFYTIRRRTDAFLRNNK